MKRPLVFMAVALAGGIVLSDAGASHEWGIVIAALIAAALLILYRQIRKLHSEFYILSVPLFLLGFFLHSHDISFHTSLFLPYSGQAAAVEGFICDEPEFRDGKFRFVLQAAALEGHRESLPEKAYIRVTIYTEEPLPDLQYGSHIKIRGEIRIPQGRRNIGGFDYQKHLAAREISGIMGESPQAVTLLEGEKKSWIKSTGFKLRKGILKAIYGCIPEKEASVAAGMLIGYTSQMPEEMEEDFRRTGLSHVLAVSGANILFLLTPLLWLLQKAGFNRRWSSAIAFPLMIGYVFATGMEASVVRAAIMAGVTLIGMILWRKTDVFCSLAASAILILAQNTYMLFDLGFILSFTATLSLVIFNKPIGARMPEKIPKSMRETLSASLSAQIGVVPVVAYSFNTFSVVSIISNLAVIPMTGFLTILAALTALAGNLYKPAGLLLGKLSACLTDIILFITHKISEIPWAQIGVATPSLMLVAAYYFVLLYLRYGHSRLKKEAARACLAGIIALSGILLFLAAFPAQKLMIYIADVGQGDCILIKTPKGKNLILDGGGSIQDKEGSYAGERIVVPALYDLNMSRIDMMMASHGHADHIGGLKTVVENLEVKKLIVSDAPDLEMRELADLAQSRGISVFRAKEGDILYREEELAVKVIYPLQEQWKMPDGAATSANELSLVIRLDYGEFSAVFTGDIGAETEERILEDGAFVDCDLLKIAHHGSKYSSREEFLDAARPKLAVVSVGNNRYGHPDPGVLERLRAKGVKVYQTIESGGILVEADKGARTVKVSTVINPD